MQYYNSEVFNKLPELIEYFNKGITKSNINISHCLLFWGPDTTTQCELALEVARLLNCNEEKSISCECGNCKWIKETEFIEDKNEIKTHPAVKIYTRLDFKETSTSTDEGESNSGKKNINIEQAKNIINELAISSPYHRVYIFCDRDEDGNLLPLNKINFPDGTSNALLKTFEEPPRNATFIFLTKDKSDVISTVVSRAQSFFVPAKFNKNEDYSLVQNIIENYWTLSSKNLLDLENKIMELLVDNSIIEVLKQIQNYQAFVLKNNINNKILYYRMLEDLNYTEEALEQVSLAKPMASTIVIENLCIKLLKK